MSEEAPDLHLSLKFVEKHCSEMLGHCQMDYSYTPETVRIWFAAPQYEMQPKPNARRGTCFRPSCTTPAPKATSRTDTLCIALYRFVSYHVIEKMHQCHSGMKPSESQHRFVVVLATNIREILDRAVLDRVAGALAGVVFE